MTIANTRRAPEWAIKMQENELAMKRLADLLGVDSDQYTLMHTQPGGSATVVHGVWLAPQLVRIIIDRLRAAEPRPDADERRSDALALMHQAFDGDEDAGIYGY